MLRAGELFPDWLKSSHPALHTSAFVMVFYGLAYVGPHRSYDNTKYASFFRFTVGGHSLNSGSGKSKISTKILEHISDRDKV